MEINLLFLNFLNKENFALILDLYLLKINKLKMDMFLEMFYDLL